MKLSNPLDLVVVDRNRLWESMRTDPTSPAHQANRRIRAASVFLQDLMDEARALAHGYPELDPTALEVAVQHAGTALDGDPDAEQIERLRQEVCAVFHRYAGEQRKLVGERDAEIGRILAIVSGSLRQAAVGREAAVTRLETAVRGMEQAARLDDPREIRTSLSQNITLLREAIKHTVQTEPPPDVSREVEMLRFRLSEVEEAAFRDPLTGVYNRRAFDLRLEHFLAAGEPLTVVLCDLDQFKQVNDTYGHLVGDECLRRAARQLQALFRPGDTVARLGGDEFAVLINGLRAQDAAERIELHFPAYADDSACSGASFGVATHHPGESPRAFLERADCYLYQAKRREAPDASRVVWQ